MPLETVALVGGVLLAIALAAMGGSLLGRRLRSVAIDRRQSDSRAAVVSEPRPGTEAMYPTPTTTLTAAPPTAAARSDVPAGAPSDAPMVAAMAAASRPATSVAPPFVVDPPPIAQAAAGVTIVDPTPIAQSAAGATIVDPLARSAVQRGDVPDYTSAAGFANRLSGVPPPVASRSTFAESPAARDRAGPRGCDGRGRGDRGEAHPPRTPAEGTQDGQDVARPTGPSMARSSLRSPSWAPSRSPRSCGRRQRARSRCPATILMCPASCSGPATPATRSRRSTRAWSGSSRRRRRR